MRLPQLTKGFRRDYAKLQRSGRKIDKLHAELVRQGLGNLIFLASAYLDQDFAQALAVGLRGLHRFVDLVLGDDPPTHEDLTDFFP